MLSNHEEIVNQLEAVAKELAHIGAVFEKGDRLFFKVGSSEKLNTIFQNADLLTEFEKKFLTWDAIVTKDSIKLIMESMVNYFFGPIEHGKAWESQNQQKARENHGKVIILTTILNNFNSPIKTIVKQQSDTAKHIANMTQDVLTHIIIRQFKSEVQH